MTATVPHVIPNAASAREGSYVSLNCRCRKQAHRSRRRLGWFRAFVRSLAPRARRDDMACLVNISYSAKPQEPAKLAIT